VFVFVFAVVFFSKNGCRIVPVIAPHACDCACIEYYNVGECDVCGMCGICDMCDM